MTNEEQITEEIKRIEELKKTDKNIDVKALVENTFARHATDTPTSGKTRAYLVSLLFPPMGLYYFVKFIVRDGADAKKTAWMSLVLTIIASVLTWWLLSASFSTNSTIKDIENINLKQIQELTQ